MHISIVTSASKGSRSGNRITSKRWARIFRQLRYEVTVDCKFHPDCDLFIGVHADKSAEELRKFLRQNPQKHAITVLAGTDLYNPKGLSDKAMYSLDHADWIVVFEPCAANRLPRRLKEKTQLIRQSAKPPAKKPPPLKSCFEISVCGHLRAEKNPFLSSDACKWLPYDSRIRINHFGKALTVAMKREAMERTRKIERYHWRDEKPHWKSRQRVARSQIMVNSSFIESSANAVIEALVSGVPVLASQIPGNIGVFGRGYQGLFPPNNCKALANLMYRAESENKFYQHLKKECQKIAAKFAPKKEINSWRKLLSAF